MNEYKTKEINEDANANVFKYINLDPSFQGVNRLFVMAYNRVDGQPIRNGQRKYYLPRISLNKYNVIIDGRMMILLMIIQLKMILKNVEN